jgi:predicted nuclease with RNAse H fold
MSNDEPGVYMLTVGVDLAAQAKSTWTAKVLWHDDAAQLIELNDNATDNDIVEATSEAYRLGIDCPLGWPLAFWKFVHAHMDFEPPDFLTDSTENLDHLAYRLTDFRVREVMGKFPLSVAANFLGRTALRCAGLQAKIENAGIAIDRAGMDGSVVEVYPAISLFRWGIDPIGYKRKANLAMLGEKVELITDAFHAN